MRNLGITPGSKGKAAAGTPAATPTSNSKREAAAAAASPGTTPPPTADAAADGSSEQQQQADERLSALRAAAAAALAAAKEGALGGVVANYNKVTVKETRRFAGKEIEVSLAVGMAFCCLLLSSLACVAQRVAVLLLSVLLLGGLSTS
jgi:hypothetical protein